MARSEKLFSLCIAIQIFSCFADQLFLSIDCGGTGNRIDGTGIKWVGDDGYIMTGKAAQVQNSSIYSQELNSLRYFPSQKKSCYVIAGVATGKKHMVRASFFYGNYDGKSSPPSFNLQFDGNTWVTLHTSSTDAYYWEVIYGPKGDKISVCVAWTSPDQIPFISTLEIREFEPSMYETDDQEDVLLRRSRIAFGAKAWVSYPDDPYDRWWHPSGKIEGVVTVARDNMSFIQNFTDIPGKALVHAITPASSKARNLTVPTSGIFSEDATYYFIFYFMEVLRAASRKNSSHGYYLTAGSNISLVNTANASLPPILNAMEVFKVQRGLANGTNAHDVNALVMLQEQYQQLQLWAGDPCLPVGFTWDWLSCNADDPPRVTELHLSGSGLEGTLLDFSSLTSLEIIDLSNNSLNGQIPNFLGTFPSLKELNLAYNNFTGPLPTSLKGNKKIQLNITGNKIKDDPIPPPPNGGRNMKPIIIGVSFWSVILFLLLVGCVI
ncbi:probable LRR receptor-like serine/threonine-protein kinase At1g51810 isoform X2 [Nymphaea colorata]|uniref:probable LRR receptor-like serine/threonine-protein kinase At1g51810 isoform X2 n=1 Tax=Nymphaea colorata TaxID=210225 RepID=UPI00129EEBA7|nr:probable LRR receptor-like serine/threonine-protein kinase At1g51810 isoform X2 [Nymphaea colorata]